MKKFTIAGAALAVALGLTSCGDTTANTSTDTTVPGKFDSAPGTVEDRRAPITVPEIPTVPTIPKGTIQGAITLMDPDGYVTITSGECGGIGGYSDMNAGANVTVRDQAGVIVGSSQLDAGTDSARGCVLPFIVEVSSAKFYTVEVTDRGVLSYSKDELDADGWRVWLTLGS